MYMIIQDLLARLPKDASRPGRTEYALLVALIAIVVLIAVVFFGNAVFSFFSRLSATVATW